MKIVFALIFSIILVFAFVLWSSAGQIVKPVDLICFTGLPDKLLWPADSKECNSRYALFYEDNEIVNGVCLNKKDYEEFIEAFSELHQWRKDCLNNPDKASVPCFPKDKDPCKGYKE